MAKLVRFPLKLKDGTGARSLEELREHGDIESILKHYQEGTLSRWLTVWKHEGELEKIKEIGRRFLENKQECLREIFKNLEIPLDENQFSEYCKTNLGDPSSLFDKDTYKGNGSGLSIKEKLTEFLPKDFSTDFSAGKGLEAWEVTELQLDEETVQVEFSCEKEGFSASLEYKKDETLYKKVASMFSFFVKASALKSEASKSDNNFNEKIAQLGGELQQQSNLTKLTIKDGILERCDREVKGEVVIPKGVTGIGWAAFSGCSSLTKVVIPEGVRSLGYKAFSGCNSLTSVVIPEDVREIGFYTFSGCSSLTSVVIPESMTEIGDNAFEGCTALTRVVIPKSVKKIGKRAFEDCVSMTSELLPSSKVVPFKDFVELFKMYKRHPSLLTIKNGVLVKCDKSIQGDLVIPEGVKEISASAFSGCSSLTSVVIPKGVTEIRDNVFDGCTSLASVIIPKNMIKIGSYAFAGCRLLNNVVIPQGVREIGDNAFDGCTSLASVVIPESVIKIGSYAFVGCRLLKNVVIPQGVREIEKYTFSGCYLLSSVEIPNSVKEIERYAFSGCRSLDEFTRQKLGSFGYTGPF